MAVDTEGQLGRDVAIVRDAVQRLFESGLRGGQAPDEMLSGQLHDFSLALELLADTLKNATVEFEKSLSLNQLEDLIAKLRGVVRGFAHPFNEDEGIEWTEPMVVKTTDTILNLLGSAIDARVAEAIFDGTDAPRLGIERLQQRLLRQQSRRILAQQIEVSEASAKVEQAAKSVAETATNVQDAAGLAGSASLAVEFETYSAGQGTSANRWMMMTAIMLAAVVSVGISLLLVEPSTSSWSRIVAHIVIALPLAGAAAYTARESSRHREAAQWARQLSAQLRAVGAYADRLDDSESSALWSAFGRYVFGPHASARGDNQLHSIPPEVVELVAKLAKN